MITAISLPVFVNGQHITISGIIRDIITRQPIAGIAVGHDNNWTFTNQSGQFSLLTNLEEIVLICSGMGYITGEFPIKIERQNLNLGELWLQPDSFRELDPESVLIEPEEIETGDSSDSGMPLLRGSRDLFLNRATFDFSSGFYRLRGQDSRETTVLFNGIPMNRSYDGRPAWSNWSGLSDISRNSEQTQGLNLSTVGFGGLNGIINIIASPDALRTGTRFTFSASNKSYQYRQMGTYNSGIGKRKLGYLISFANRSAATGYVDGTPFVARSGFASIQWKPNRANSILVTGMLSSTKRGASAPLTDELFSLKGSRYNPYWGVFRGVNRSSRERIIQEPYLMLLYALQSKKFSWNVAAGYQWGSQLRTRLAFVNAANPDPAYYRTLPSFYYNNPVGANYNNVILARDSFIESAQIDWDDLVGTNEIDPGAVKYFLSGDQQRGKRYQIRSVFDKRFTANNIQIQGGIGLVSDRIDFNGKLLDLLGASYYEDVDSFNQSRNDLNGAIQKQVGNRIGYAYGMTALEWNTFLQGQWIKGPWEGGISAFYTGSRYNREGYFKNERYPENSNTQSPDYGYSGYGVKGSLLYRLSGHFWTQVQLGQAKRPPLLKDVFLDPREHDLPFPSTKMSEHLAGAVDLYIRYPWLNGRVSAYQIRNTHGRMLKSYFAETAFGAGFMREATENLNTEQVGIESGMEFRLSSEVAFTLALAIGSNTFIDNPHTRLYYYPEPGNLDLLPDSGNLDMGKAKIKGLHLARGPENAMSVGISYRDPKFWWIDIRSNYMDKSYTDIALLRHVDGFELLPETGITDASITPEALVNIRKQYPLPGFYQLNLSAGKSWMRHKNYVNVFVGLNNLFDDRSPTGGFEQGRLATFSGLMEDQISGHPSFGTKYWYGNGRTFFINLSWSF